jgi:hypothetical protein
METLREARRVAFEQAGIAPDGGDSEAWVEFKLGPIPMPFPNSDARRRAVKFHDLHHVLTGYRTDIIGEFEISAWEIAAGCGAFAVPWLLNLMGLTAGLLVAPVRTARAFFRGSQSRSLYTTLSFDEVIDQPTGVVAARLGLPPADAPLRASLKGTLQLVSATVAGLVLGAMLMVLVMTPVTLLAWLVTYSRYRRQRRARVAEALP